MDAERSAAAVASVQRAGAAALRAGTAQAWRQAEVVEHRRHRQLTLDVGEVECDRTLDLAPNLAANLAPNLAIDLLISSSDGRNLWYTFRTGRDDLFHCRHDRCE